MASRSEQKLTRRQRKLAEKGEQKLQRVPTLKQQHFDLMYVEPKTLNQEKVFGDYKEGYDLFLHGAPGTGKTFLSMYLALNEIMDFKTEKKRLVIIRSAQPSKQIGFLPGSEKEKLAVYERPYRTAAEKLFGRGDAYDILVQKGLIHFESTSFLRGNEFEDAIVLLEETQNMTYGEIKTCMSRIGDNCRVIINGDGKQDDLTSARYNEESGLATLKKVLEKMGCVAYTEFGIQDIVRSGFVRSFIEAEYELGLC